MRASKKIIITMVGVVLLVLFVIIIVNRISTIPGEEKSNPNQPVSVAQSTDAPYSPPVDNTPSFTVTPETTPHPLITLSTIQANHPTITPIATIPAAADETGDIFYITYDDHQQAKVKKIKTDKQGKKKSESEVVAGLIPGETINYILPSPDGMLLLVRFLAEGPMDELFDLKNGMMSERVFPLDYKDFFGWHADSKHLLVSDWQGLWLIDTQGKDDRLLTMPDIEGNDIHGAASSPDGRQVIYSISLQGGMGEIWMVNADGSDTRKILEIQGDATNFAWSPDGSRIVFWDGGYFIMKADGTDFKLLSELPGRGGRNVDLSPLWSPDGHYLLTDISFPEVGLSDYNKSNIYLINVENGETKPLLPDGSSGHLYPSWSPTGNKIAFLSMKNGQVDLWVTDIDGNNRIQLTTDGEFKFFQFWRK